MANAAFMGGMILAPGLSALGAGNKGSIFPQDQALTNQWHLEKAMGMQQAAAYEDGDVDQGQSLPGGGGSSLVLIGSVVIGGSLCVFGLLMMMMMLTMS